MNDWNLKRYHRRVNRWFGLGAVMLAVYAILQWPSGFHGVTVEGVQHLMTLIVGTVIGVIALWLFCMILLGIIESGFWSWLNGD